MKQAQRSGGLWRFLGLSMLLWLCTLASLQAQSSLQSQPAANASGNASTSASTTARPIRVLLGLPPGGSVELLARIYADRLRVALGVPVLIENRAGASGLIAMEAMLAAPRDGTTLLFAPNGGVTLVPQIMKSAKFDPFKDVQPLARVGHAGFVLAVNAKVTASNVSEFLAQARSDAGLRNFGSATGTIPHLAGALFANATRLDLQYIPYKGSGQVVLDLVGGQLLASIIAPTEGEQHARSGKLRLLAQTGARRSVLMPALPTLRESGVEMDMESWYGFYAATGTPAAVVDRLSQLLLEAVRNAEVRERMAQIGIEPSGLAGAELVRLMQADYALWSRAIKFSGIQPQ